MSNYDIELRSVSKSFAGLNVVKDIDLAIEPGDFVSILGPSGCGKTTTLNMIAGFATPSRGEIRIRGESQAMVPPEKRNLGLVFQNYALFPHMTVAENVGFGLRMRGMPATAIAKAVKAALQSVHLGDLGERYPKELSGGQQQRVALARAIAPKPSVLLLDEPLSNLDLKLREAMRVELKDIHETLNMTFVYVTHDQEEAMAMSDRIIVMDGGEIAQQGTPGEIYRTPASRFVADFIGRSNILPVDACLRSTTGIELSIAGSAIVLVTPQADDPGAIRFCSLRPQSLRLDESGERTAGTNRFAATVRRTVDLGAFCEVELATEGGHRLVLHHPARAPRHPPAPQETVMIAVDWADVRALPF